MLAVELTGISKKYRFYPNKLSRVKEAFHPFKKKFHREFYALRDIDLSVNSGESIGILGRNGAGKSTLIRVIAGITTPTSGQRKTHGKVIALFRLGAGFNPEFTGIENIYFYSSLLGYSKKEVDGFLQRVLDFAEIGDFVYQPVKTYSSGMQARLAFAVAVNVDPDILILDEVLSVGDVLFRRKCFAEMKKFFEGGKTVFLVSHNQQVIAQHCQRAILLHEGELILDGPPKEVGKYYEQLLFAEGENAESLRNLIVNLDLEGSMEIGRTSDTSDDESERDFEDQGDESIQNEATPYYIPDFLSIRSSRVTQGEVHIDRMRVETAAGQRVNSLVMNDTYSIRFFLTFGAGHKVVRILCGIKKLNGIVVSGVRIPETEPLKNIRAGDCFDIIVTFECRLSPGDYFIDIRILDQSVLHRPNIGQFFDVTAFRVQKSKTPYWGLVNLYQQVSVRKTESSAPE